MDRDKRAIQMWCTSPAGLEAPDGRIGWFAPLIIRKRKIENPELFVSHDGITWRIPTGLKNPIVAPPDIKGDHHSDPDMIHHDGELWLLTRRSFRSHTPKQNVLYLTKSKCGVTWSQPIEILRDASGRELLSPAVIYDGKRFVMWTVEIEAERFKLIPGPASMGFNGRPGNSDRGRNGC